jgi:flagellin-like hook-associated protein FlgL
MTQFVTKGDAPLTPAQLEKRAQKYIKRSWPDQAREKSIRLADGEFDAFMATFSANHDVNIANNTFNWQLAEYRKATARLARYRLADGRPEVYEDQPTGEYDDEGNEVMESVLVQTAIDPLDATVEQTTYDDEGNATTETVDNPLIVADDAERDAAQAVVDNTPEDVLLWA